MRIFISVLVFVSIIGFLAQKTYAQDQEVMGQIEGMLLYIPNNQNVEPNEGLVSISQEAMAQRKYDLVMDRWKNKQQSKWERLPLEPFIINASAYTAAADECGKSDGITSSGIKVQENRTIACPPQYPFGATIEIEGMGIYRCEDRGGAIKGNHFDIYMETKSEAFAFGRRNLTAQVLR